MGDDLESAIFDPLAELDGGMSGSGSGTTKEKSGVEGQIHIRIQKRSGRKSITTVQGLTTAQAKKALPVLRKRLATNGAMIADAEFGDVVQLQGDQREAVRSYLLKELKMKEANIKVHGY